MNIKPIKIIKEKKNIFIGVLIYILIILFVIFFTKRGSYTEEQHPVQSIKHGFNFNYEEQQPIIPQSTLYSSNDEDQHPMQSTIYSFIDEEQQPIQSVIIESSISGLIDMVYINGRSFTMGSPANEPGRFDNEIQHRVMVVSFYMSKYLVTQKVYEEVMRANPSRFKGPDLPVEQVNWYDAIEFCNALSIKEGLTPAYNIDKSISDPDNISDYDNVKWLVTWNYNANGYRLPTEAEWEYACRAGTTTPFNTGNNITTEQANYNGDYLYNNSPIGIYRESTTPVGSFTSNAWGLYDMHGNVWEWCWNWYGSYDSEDYNTLVGPDSGDYRVLRGGSWNTYIRYLRSAIRYGLSPSFRYGSIGIRLVRPL